MTPLALFIYTPGDIIAGAATLLLLLWIGYEAFIDWITKDH